MCNYIIKYRGLYLVGYDYSNLLNSVISFEFDYSSENVVAFYTLKEAEDVRKKLGIGKIYKHVDMYELVY